MIGEIKMILVVVAASELLPIAICDSSKPPGSSIVKIDGNAFKTSMVVVASPMA
ncbi:hypothetical protein OAP99_00605 [Flavobacteriaceae bacterium]|nr:hypothetical protein [Flavobacteriaceae bacterium]